MDNLENILKTPLCYELNTLATQRYIVYYLVQNQFSNSLDDPKIFKIQENLMIIIIKLVKYIKIGSKQGTLWNLLKWNHCLLK